MGRIRLDFPADAFFFSVTQEVRFSDVNMGMHLGNDSLVTLIGEARTKLLLHYGIPEVGSPGTLVGDLAVMYKAEGRLHDQLRIDIGVQDLGPRGGDLIYRVVRESDQRTIALARTGLVFFDYATATLATPPAEFLALFDREAS